MIDINLIAGIDDATKCPCIGSIFIAAVVADEATIETWKQQGVADSKLISPKKRERLATLIKQTARTFTIQEVMPHMIDDKAIFNLNDWEMLVVLNCVKKITRKAQPSKIYIDNWETSTKGFTKRLKKIVSPKLKKIRREKLFVLNRKNLLAQNYIAEHRADENYTVVGAASILAKVASDAQYRRYRKKFGDFGSGNPGDTKTKQFLWLHRHNPLPIIRTSWKTFQRIAALETLDEEL